MMDKKSEIENWETESSRDFHQKQYYEPKRSTAAFNEFLIKCGSIRNSKRILDFGCGGGAADVYLAACHKQLYIDGIDIVDRFFYLFEEFASDDIKHRVSLQKEDFYKLDLSSMRGKYDGVISMQTISCMENWEEPLSRMCGLEPEWIGISALFYEGKIDYQIKIKDYEEKGLTQDFTEKYYNTCELKVCTTKKPENPSVLLALPVVHELSALCMIWAFALKDGKNISENSA